MANTTATVAATNVVMSAISSTTAGKAVTTAVKIVRSAPSVKAMTIKAPNKPNTRKRCLEKQKKVQTKLLYATFWLP